MTTNESFLKQYAQPGDIVVCEDQSRWHVLLGEFLQSCTDISSRGQYNFATTWVDKLKIKEILRIDWSTRREMTDWIVYTVVATFPKEPTEKEKMLEQIARLELEVAKLKTHVGGMK